MPTPPGDAPFTVTDLPGERAEAAIRDGLSGYNFEKAGYRDQRPLAVLVSDPDTGEVVGGLYGSTSMGLLRIDRFFLPERLRKQGLGSRILKAAEEEGVRRGCSRAILSTLFFPGARLLRAPGLAGARPHRLRSAGPHPIYDDQKARAPVGGARSFVSPAYPAVSCQENRVTANLSRG